MKHLRILTIFLGAFFILSSNSKVFAQDVRDELAKQMAEEEPETFYKDESENISILIKVRKAVPIERKKGFAYKESIELFLSYNDNFYWANISDYDGDNIADSIEVIEITKSLTTAIGFYRGPKHYEYGVEMSGKKDSVPPPIGIINIDLKSPFMGKGEYTPVEKGEEVKRIERQFKRADDVFEAIIKDKILEGAWYTTLVCQRPFTRKEAGKYPYSWFSTAETEGFLENNPEVVDEWEILQKFQKKT